MNEEDRCSEATLEIQRALRQRGLMELANDAATIRRFAATRDYNVAATLELFVSYHGYACLLSTEAPLLFLGFRRRGEVRNQWSRLRVAEGRRTLEDGRCKPQPTSSVPGEAISLFAHAHTLARPGARVVQVADGGGVADAAG